MLYAQQNRVFALKSSFTLWPYFKRKTFLISECRRAGRQYQQIYRTKVLLSGSLVCIALQDSDDIVHPLLFACETKNPRFIQLSLTSLQRLISQNAIPEVWQNMSTCGGIGLVYCLYAEKRPQVPVLACWLILLDILWQRATFLADSCLLRVNNLFGTPLCLLSLDEYLVLCWRMCFLPPLGLITLNEYLPGHVLGKQGM